MHNKSKHCCIQELGRQWQNLTQPNSLSDRDASSALTDKRTSVTTTIVASTTPVVRATPPGLGHAMSRASSAAAAKMLDGCAGCAAGDGSGEACPAFIAASRDAIESVGAALPGCGGASSDGGGGATWRRKRGE